MSQTTTRKDSANSLGVIRSIKTVERDHCPHWKRHVSEQQHGRAYVEFSLGDYQGGLQLSIDTTERFEDMDTGRESAKRTMVSLNEEATRQLYAILHERFTAFSKELEPLFERMRSIVARPVPDFSGLRPDLAKAATYRAAQMWCYVNADGAAFFVTEDKARKMQARSGGTVYPPL